MDLSNLQIAGSLTASVIAQGGLSVTQLPTPVNAAFDLVQTSTTSIGPGTYFYRVSATNDFGETLASVATSITVTGAGVWGIVIKWGAVPGATGYKIYGRTAGMEQFLYTVVGGGNCAVLEINLNTVPSGALPTVNTTGKATFSGGISGPTIGGIVGGGLGSNTLATVADITLDVNTTTGNDATGNGTAGLPFKTIMRAVDAIPLIRRHICTVRVFAGTYAETIKDGGIYVDNGLFTGKLIIQGQDFTTPVLGSGSITSGTLGTAPATGCTRTVAGAAWTVNELKKYMVRITSGSLNGNYYPVAANAAGSLDIPNTSASLNAATFDIVTQAVVVTRTPGLFMSAVIGNSGGVFGSNGMVLQRLKLNSGSFYGLYAAQGGCQLLETLVDGQTFAGILIAGFNSQVSCSRTYIQNLASQTGISGNESSNLAIGGSVIDGGALGMQISASLRFSMNSSGHLVVQNATTAGLDFRAGPLVADSFSTQKPILRGNAVGLRVQGSAHFLMQNWEITGNTSHGVQMVANQYTNAHNAINAVGCKITGNGGDGIRVETPHNHIQFGGVGADISGNTGYGVRFGGNPAGYAEASHNSAMFDANVAMGTNTAGDVTHDNGVTIKTIAQLRVDGFQSDVNLFNRVAAV